MAQEAFCAFDERSVLEALYKAILEREADERGLAANLSYLREHGLERTIRGFVHSEEFKRLVSSPKIQFKPNFQLNWAPPMQVEGEISADHTNKLWKHVAEVWSKLGEEDPYWSVLTNEEFRQENMNNRQILDAFYDSGEGDVKYLLAFLARAGVKMPSHTTVAEFGCGVGRVTRFLAREFSHVVAVDISSPHLAAAEARLKGEGLKNVDYVQLTSLDSLKALKNIDMFFSMIVLQHNPPPIMLDVLEHAFSSLNQRGIAFFQVPTYALGYQFSLDSFYKNEALQKSMEMHYLPQRDIFRLADEHKMRLLEVRQDHCIGMYDRAISNTFLMQKG
jgi:2-polyprenyl-3-methyl-5-hydroxy-6-metoxy-1,4-benzoquinol methylase